MPFLDQTGDETVEILPRVFAGIEKDEEAIKAVGDGNELFKMERKGWRG